MLCIWIICGTFLSNFISGTEIKEYCQFDVFQPNCQSAETVVITIARFGRMNLGKCIKKEPKFEILSDPQYLGCYVDITKKLSQKCIGQNSCSIKITDLNVENKVPCYENLIMYLEAEYKCISVLQESKHCSVSLTVDSVQHIMKKAVKIETDGSVNKHCGTERQPWIIEAHKGQKISVTKLSQTLQDINDRMESDKKSLNGCDKDEEMDGYVYDREKKRKTIICGNRFEYISSANQLEIVLEPKSNKTKFLKLQATGCSDLIPPADAWLKRTEDEAIIGCYSTRLRWQLKCIGQRWMGVIGNCSYTYDNVHEPKTIITDALAEPSEEKYSQAFTVTIICALGIIICSLIVCIGIVCLKRYTNESKVVESLLKDKQCVLLNGTLSNSGRVAYDQGRQHLYETGEKMPEESLDSQGQYFILEKEETDKFEKL